MCSTLLYATMSNPLEQSAPASIPIVGQTENTNIKVQQPDSLSSISELTAFVVLVGACGFILREVVKGAAKWMEASIRTAAENQKMIIDSSKSDQELLRTVFIQQNDRVVGAIEKQTDSIGALNNRIENLMQVLWLSKKVHTNNSGEREHGNSESA